MEKRFDLRVVVTLTAIHVLAIGLCWFTFTWWGLGTFFLLSVVSGLGITVGYHRLFTHHGFRTRPWVRKAFALCGMAAGQGTVIEWVGVHRLHHAHSDSEKDPHSPIHGKIHAHVGWALRKKTMTEQKKIRGITKDLQEDDFIKRWSTSARYAGLNLILIAATAMTGFLIGGLPVASSMLVWGIFLRMVFVYHWTWAVNSATHLWGYRNYRDTGDASRNNWIVALFTFGEGWHNNHHAVQHATNHGQRPWEIDMSYWLIRLLGLLGLAWHIRVAIYPEKKEWILFPEEH